MVYKCEFCDYESTSARCLKDHEAEHYMLTPLEYKTWERMEKDYSDTVDDTVKQDMADKLNKFIDEHPQLRTMPIPSHFFPDNG